ncbi:SRPBCC family protein [Croceimicrobium sp.]|uniref:SRPBCC family protein n=1 Tax=Croceimicrobium sp. TaxID=2828340 RepID=UPI003BACC80A
MKALKSVIIGVVVLIGALLLAALFVSKDFSYEQSVHIDAPVLQVWNHTNSLESMNDWSPWASIDPDMKQEYKGASGTVGSENCWDSENENVGAGCQTITKVAAPYTLETHLHFTRPFDSHGDAYVKLSESAGGTKVIWGMKSEMAYPMNIMNLFMSAEDAMSADFSKGLKKLKNLSEA